MDIDILTRDELIDLLSKAKDDNIQLIDRDKNYDFRTTHNITIDDIKGVIKGLRVEDIVKGPVPDYNANRNHPLWIFKKLYIGMVVYIKIKVINKGKVIIVISFHEDE